jgi:hypothetical protein
VAEEATAGLRATVSALEAAVAERGSELERLAVRSRAQEELRRSMHETIQVG